MLGAGGLCLWAAVRLGGQEGWVCLGIQDPSGTDSMYMILLQALPNPQAASPPLDLEFASIS